MVQERTYPELTALLRDLVSEIVHRLEAGIADRGTASIAVAGGRFPKPLFSALSTQELDWSRVTVTLGDDRWVPATDPLSNEKLVRDHLLQNAAAAARFVPLTAPVETPEAGLHEVAARLQTIPRPFDVVLLGMGEDGHTASLFPSAPAAELAQGLAPVDGAPVAALNPPVSPVPRISLTLPTLLQARYIGLHITGQAKWDVYQRARQPGAMATLPVRGILHQERVPVDVWWTV